MNPTAMTTLETQSLIEAACAGMADDDQVRHLESLLLADEGARKYYVYLRDLDANLRWLAGARRDGTAAAREFRIVEPTPPQPSSPIFPSTAFHGTAAYFSSGWPVAYSIATVVLGLGLLVGAFTHVSRFEKIAGDRSPMTVDRESGLPSEAEIVGRITGVHACKWAVPSRDAVYGAGVPLGRKYAIASGLIEITYKTGSKVILQGPAAYVVESPNGGYLSVGKLTGEVTTETARGFAVRTPTAVVTDLGTEFGVEVDEAGRTTSHVFRGKVNVQATGNDGKPTDAEQVLHAGESAMVDAVGQNRIALLGSSVAARFVRQLPKSPDKESASFELVASWHFDGQNFLADSSGRGHTLVNRGATQIDGVASFNGAAILRTIDSVDLTPYKKIRVSWSQKAVGPFTEEILWEQTSNYCHTPGAIVAHLTAQEAYSGVATQHLGKETYRLESFPIASNQWEDFAMECDLTSLKRSGIVKVFRNGIRIGRGTSAFGPAPASFVNAPIFIGARDGLIAPFIGQIDNLKIEGEAAEIR
jgi:hypothetical protein